ncbi:MAG: diaminopimelate decarboxylase [bacterium]|nr:diaminopimelate decarboxylase [bacterium]
MHQFQYRNNELYCEQVRIKDIAEQVGTPFYLYSRQTLIEHYRRLDTAFAAIDHLICYSIKANFNLALCKLLCEQGCGADIVSGGELYRALQAGFDPQKIVYAGVGKTAEEIEYALNSNILMFNVESMPEAELISQIATRLKKTAKLAIRVNPDVDAHTHDYITTGKKENKFGIDYHDAPEFYHRVKQLPNLAVVGMHIHIGSQIETPQPYIASIKRVITLLHKLRDSGIHLDVFNMGGGMGIVYHNERPMPATEFAAAIVPLVANLGCRLILEPGRYLVGNAGILLTKVLYVKKTHEKTFVIVDAAMTDLIRPALYNAYHEILPVVKNDSAKMLEADIVGPVCESGDFFAHNRKIQEVQSGDLVAIMSAGAYGFSMASNYNCRPRPAEVLVEHATYRIVRKRETYEDLLKNEK